MAKIKTGLVLPSAPVGPERIWNPVVRRGRVIPFGYSQDPDDAFVLQPIPDELEALELAKKYLKEYSYREVTEWLTKTTGRYISHVGLKKRVDIERKRENTAAAARRFEEEARQAAEKARSLEAGVGGISTREIRHPKDCSCPICTGNV